MYAVMVYIIIVLYTETSAILGLIDPARNFFHICILGALKFAYYYHLYLAQLEIYRHETDIN